MTNTDKCPKCGYQIPLHDYCECGYNPTSKFMEPELALIAAMHRIRELEARIARTEKDVEFARQQLPFMHHTGKVEDCPTFYDGCNCTVENLAGLLDQAHADSAKIRELEAALSDIDTISRSPRTVAEQHEEIVELAREALKK